MENNRGAEILPCVYGGSERGNIPSSHLEELNTSWGQLLTIQHLFQLNTCFSTWCLHPPAKSKAQGEIFSPRVWRCSSQNQCREKHLWSALSCHCLQWQRHCHSRQDKDWRRMQIVSNPFLPFFFFFSPLRIFKWICLASSRCSTEDWHIQGAESIIWLLLLLPKQLWGTCRFKNLFLLIKKKNPNNPH